MYLYKSEVQQSGNFIDIEVTMKSAYDRISTADGLEYLSKLFSDIAGKPLRARIFMKGDRPEEKEEPEGASIMDIVKKKEQYDDIININY